MYRVGPADDIVGISKERLQTDRAFFERPLVIVDQAAFGPVDKATVAMPAFEHPALAATHTGVVAVLQEPSTI